MMSDIEKCKSIIGEGIVHTEKAEGNLKGTLESLDDARTHLANAMGSLGLAFAALRNASGGVEAAADDFANARGSFEKVSSISYASGDNPVANTATEVADKAQDKAKQLTEELAGFMSLVGDGSLSTPGVIGVIDELVHRHDDLAKGLTVFAKAAPDDIRFLAGVWQETI